MFTRGGTMVCDGCQLDKINFSEFGSCCRKYQCNTKHNCGENASSSTVVTGKEIARNIYYTASLLKSSWTCFHGFLLYAFQFTSGVYLFVWSSVYDPFFVFFFFIQKLICFLFILQLNDLILTFHSIEASISSFESLIPCMNSQLRLPGNQFLIVVLKM